MATTPDGLAAAGGAAVVAATVPVAIDNPGYILYVLVGVVAGTIWRSRYWFTEKGFDRRAFITDTTSMGALSIGSFGICDYWHIYGWTAALVSVFSSIVGVEPIRNIVLLWVNSKRDKLDEIADGLLPPNKPIDEKGDKP